MLDSAVKFEDFELDGGRYELRRGDRILKLEKIPMELLTILVANEGRLVSRDEIIEKIWGKDVFLDTEHGINTAIRKIRQVLGDDPDQPRFVQTVTGKGYRFIATTTALPPARGNGDRSTPKSTPTVQPDVALSQLSRQSPEPRPSGFPQGAAIRRLTILVIVIVGAAALLVGLNVRGWRDRLFGNSSTPRIHSLAVLPLENLSADPAQEYFADGMTDELITMLAKNPGLRIVSRTSVMEYKKAHRPLPDIARALGVDGILEGSIERSGTRVHINAQLIYAPGDRHLWAESYDRDVSDLGALQSDLARNIAKQVGLSAATTPTPRHLINPEAHDAYLMGRYYWFGDQPEKSREYFLKAIQLQPDYAAAYAALADAYGAAVAGGAPKADLQEAATKVEAAARQALVLDDSIAETHNTMAAFYALFAWNLAAADRESGRAVELDPSFALAHHKRSRILFALGRNQEALQEERMAMEIDPRVQPSGLGEALFHTRQYDAAIAELRAREEVQPNDDEIHIILADVYWHKGMAAEFAHEQALAYVPKSATELETAFRHGGARAVTEWELAHVKKLQAKTYMSPLRIAMVCARTGRKEETLRYLEQAYEEHVPWMAFVGVEPDLDFLRSEPRYQAIAKKMGWPLVP